MKSLLFFGSIILSIAIIIGGHFYYQQKLDSIAADSTASSPESSVSTETQIDNQTVEANESTASLGGLLQEWSEPVTDGTLNITVFGSTSVTYEGDSLSSWPNLLETQIKAIEGTPDVSTTIVDAGTTVSIELVHSEYITQVINSQPDVLLFEPFILNDNGSIRIEDSLDALELMLQRLSTSLPDTNIAIVPANPLYGANFYLSQIEQLKLFSTENEYVYLDHWEHWPSTEDPSLNDFIENARPNAEGHALWAEAILNVITQ